MKFYKIYRYVFIVSLLFNNAIANPPLRLIIQFEFSLDAIQKKRIKDQLTSILQSEYSVLAHSSDNRWIVKVKPESQVKIEQAIDDIKRLESVKYVEPDQVLKAIH